LSYPGSSGGGNFDADGGLIGLNVACKAPGIGYGVALDDIFHWLRLQKLDWVLDPLVPVPSKAQLLKEAP
jgi:hypothetical protein